jgi:hypothetical protein
MNLLFARSQTAHKFSAPTFSLWAKFELTDEEATLIEKYRPNSALLSEDEPTMRTRKWRRALIFGGIIAGLIGMVMWLYMRGNVHLPIQHIVFGPYLSALIAWPIATHLIFSKIREDVIVADVLTGRRFQCKSIDKLFQKENDIRQMAYKFRDFLEGMKDWGGTETVRIEPGQMAALPATEASRDK